MSNVMPDALVGILGLLIWITSKIIYIFLEIIIIENVLYKRNKLVGYKFWELLKKYYEINGAEIKATIFHSLLNACTFLVTLIICTYHITPEGCDYVCNHIYFILSFDLIITITILLLLNYLLKYKIVYQKECKPFLPDDSVYEKIKEFLSQ